MLRGKAVSLREARDSDFPVLGAIRNDLDLQLALMATPRPNTQERVENWVRRRANDPTGAFFVAALTDDSEPIGFLQLVNIDTLHRHAELGICVAPSHRGTGRAEEALALLEEYAAATLGLRKIVLRVLASNSRAIAFYEKCGFTRVGVLAQHHYQQGAFRDVLIMEKKIGASAA